MQIINVSLATKAYKSVNSRKTAKIPWQFPDNSSQNRIPRYSLVFEKLGTLN